MSLNTHSKFYFGCEVDSSNFYAEFDEGGPDLVATVAIGSYTLEQIATAVAQALTAAGTQTYTASVDRATRKITFSALANFSLHVESGMFLDAAIWDTIGYATDKTGANNYEGDDPASDEYTTQFILQSYVAPEDFQQAADATVNESASGRVEIVTFGTRQFFEMDFKFITNQVQPAGSPIRNRATGHEDFRSFIQFLVTKAPVEFMPDEDQPDTFVNILLESTPTDTKGTGYKLKELYDKNLPKYFETGVVKFRVIDF